MFQSDLKWLGSSFVISHLQKVAGTVSGRSHSEDIKILSVNINYFHQFFGFFDIFLLLLLEIWKKMNVSRTCMSCWNNYYFFYKFYNLFCRRHSLMRRPCYNNLFQFMKHDNFWNLNRVIFIHWKHLESQMNALWYCFQ